MQSKFIFGCLEVKRRACEIPFAKSIVYSDVELDKRGQSYESFFCSKNAENLSLEIADGHSHWQILNVLRTLITRNYENKKLKIGCRKKLQEK